MPRTGITILAGGKEHREADGGILPQIICASAGARQNLRLCFWLFKKDFISIRGLAEPLWKQHYSKAAVKNFREGVIAPPGAFYRTPPGRIS